MNSESTFDSQWKKRQGVSFPTVENSNNVLHFFYARCTLFFTQRKEHSNVFQTHIVIVGQVRNMSFFLKLWYSVCILSKNIWKKHQNAHLSHNYYMCLKNVTVFLSLFIFDTYNRDLGYLARGSLDELKFSVARSNKLVMRFSYLLSVGFKTGFKTLFDSLSRLSWIPWHSECTGASLV